ncbi:MAG: hypothetical protein CJBNEKGG_02863 [Prosthecobacter sp.]|nr:hypothetical protein [Prosthecobacter sp.]
MRIKSISVRGLFGVFNHVIRMNLDDRITIIHGPNGFGKTALLRIIQSLFLSRLSRLRRTPFDELDIDFVGDAMLQIRRQKTELLKDFADNGDAILSFALIEKGQVKETYHLPDLLGKNAMQRGEMLESYLQHSAPAMEIERAGKDSWLHLPTGSILTGEEAAEMYSDYLPRELQPKATIPDWLSQLTSSVGVRFIEAQRLLGFSSERRVRGYERGFRLEPTVLRCSNEMAMLIRDKQTEYGKKAQQLDSTFPSRVLQLQSGKSVPVEQLKERLESLEAQQQRLLSVGVLPAEDHRRSMPAGDSSDEATRRILSLYVGDVEEKLSVFNSLTERVETLQRVINERFSYKRLEIDARTGFRFVGRGDKNLQSTDLSSGEQHELVLFYELLFKTEENALILIDEPELSLHVAWQVQFLKDLSAVTRLSGFDVLMATHSPQIINDRWDLTVELKGPDDVTKP